LTDGAEAYLYDTTLFATSSYVNTGLKWGVWHDICYLGDIVVAMRSEAGEANVLASGAAWAWPETLRDMTRAGSP